MTLVAKLEWKARKNPSLLWAFTLLSKYTERNKLDINTKAAIYRSKIWKDLLLRWKICQKGIKWVRRDGKTTSFCFHKWMSNGKILREQIHGPLGEKDSLVTVGEIFMKQNLINPHVISSNLPQDIVHKINNTYRTPNKKNSITWKPSKKGLFTTSSIYKFLTNQYKQESPTTFN